MRWARDKFFQGYRSAFGKLSQEQVSGLDFLLSAFETDERWSDVRHVSYALATIRHETAHTYQPISERGSAAYLSKYWTNANIRRNLGNTEPADAQRYKGRGFVQITGRSNYTRFGIADHPEKALEPQTAFEIMTRGMHEGLFTGKRLKDYIKGDKADYVQARRIINRLDKAKEIAAYARMFEEMLREAESPETITKAADTAKGVTTSDKPADETEGTPPPAPAVEIKASRPTLKSTIAAIITFLMGPLAYFGIDTREAGRAGAEFARNNTALALKLLAGFIFIVLAVYIWNRAMERAHGRTQKLMDAAADKDSNNLRLI